MQQFPFIPAPFLDTAQNFPVKAFPEDLWRSAVSIQKLTQAPGEIILNTMLSAIATIFQAHFDVEGINGGPIPISQFMMAISPSGEGKTSAQRVISKPLLEFSTKIEAISLQALENYNSKTLEWSKILDGLSSKKGKLLAEGKDINDVEETLVTHRNNKPTRPKESRLITNDPSPAGLKSWLSSGLGCGLVLNADSGKLINGPLLREPSLLCDIWSGENVTVDRGTYHLTIPHPRVTISLMTQGNFVHELLQKNGDDFRGSGLSGRFLMYVPASRIGRRQLGAQLSDEDNHQLDAYYQKATERLENLYFDGQTIPTTKKIVGLSSDAREHLVNMAQQIEHAMAPGGNLYFMPEFATKMVEHTCRIAALFTLYNGSDQEIISLGNAQRAAQVVDYFANQYSAIHSPYCGPVRDIISANLLLEFMTIKAQYGMFNVPRTLIMQNAPVTLRKKQDLDNAIMLLIQNGRIAISPVPGKGAGNTRMAYCIISPVQLALPQF